MVLLQVVWCCHILIIEFGTLLSHCEEYVSLMCEVGLQAAAFPNIAAKVAVS